jgi:regulator of CtrA degradation
MTDLGATGVAVVGAPRERAEIVRDFAKSALFDRTFKDGMSLVEDTAAYLDGLGRQESRSLSKASALAYASESMRLTTQLMQVASWLLVQRAVREGDMAATEACEARYRIDPAGRRIVGGETASYEVELLPAGLTALVDRAGRLYERVVHLDQRMYCEVIEDDGVNAVVAQLDRLRAAFAG